MHGNYSSEDSFRVHPATRIRRCGNVTMAAQTARCQAYDGVTLISDEHTEAALRAALDAASHHLEFCLCTEDMLESLPAPSPKEMDSSQAGNTKVSTDFRSSSRHKSDSHYVSPHFQCLTAGSSGSARRVRRSHASWIKTFGINAAIHEITTQDSYALIGRLSHSLPLYAALEAQYLGADVHVFDKLSPATQLQGLRDCQTSILYLTPSQARLLCKAAATLSGPKNFAMRKVFSGGGKLDKQTRAALAVLFPQADILEFYGASETSFITLGNESTPEHSVGQAFPGVSLKILDEQHNPTKGIGQIWIKSEYLFSGYASGPMRDTLWRDEFLSVGEMGRMDSSGNLILCGRKSRIANVAETTVFLQDIENLLLSHSQVSLCAVLTRSDPLRGQVLVAIVEGSDSENLRHSVLSHLRQALPPLLIPKVLYFIDSIPMLSAGKPDIQTLQSWIEDQ